MHIDFIIPMWFVYSSFGLSISLIIYCTLYDWYKGYTLILGEIFVYSLLLCIPLLNIWMMFVVLDELGNISIKRRK